MTRSPRPSTPVLSTPVLAALLCLLWSSAFVFIKLALRDATAAQFAALRVVTSVPPVLAVLLVLDRAGLLRALRDRRVHGIGLVLGLVNVAGYVGLQTAGFGLAGIGFGAVLIYAQPLLVAVLARFFLAERLRPRQVLGLLTGWLGVGLAVLGETSRTGTGEDLWLAVLLFLGAAASFAIGTVVVKAVGNGPGTALLPPALLLALCYGAVPLVALAATDGAPVQWTGRLLVSTVYTGAISLAGGYLLQFALLRRGDAGVVSSYIFAVPILAAVFGVVLLGERLSAGLVVGGAAVAAGILLVTWPAATPRRAAAASPRTPGP